MSIKSFLMKSALRAKGVDKEQAEAIAAEIEKNPEVMSALKSLEDNKEVKELFEKMQKEMDEYKKNGMADMYAMAMVSEKYKADIVKHRDALMPLMQLMMKK
ncbi:MAG: hypothetical protein WCQ32_01760 [bacterium]